MDKIAILSDIHANITALKAVLSDIKSRKINRIICLGDSIFKGVSPDLTIDIIKKECEIILLGNCDEFIASQKALEKRFWSRIKI